MTKKVIQDSFVDWFRRSSPYIHAHRGRTFVISFGGEAVADERFPNLVHDLALLQGLGIRLVLIHGARPQIAQRLQARGADMQYINGLRVTDDIALACVKEAAGAVLVEIEALLSMGLANSPMAGARIRVASGNYVTAKPIGIREGIDYCHTGEVRRVDTQAIHQRLDDGAIALVPPIGYSPTGEVFNLSAADVSRAVALALNADKLIFLVEGKGLLGAGDRLISNVSPNKLEQILTQRKRMTEELLQQLQAAITASRGGVQRIHLISRKTDGALLRELFTRDGVGTLITKEPYETIRRATIDDVGGIIELLTPLEQKGVLVRRSREQLEMEIDHFFVAERDGMIVACAALIYYPAEAMAELACVAVHPDYRNEGRGDQLLAHLNADALAQHIDRMFVLTTQTAHWFIERGFSSASLQDLPMAKQAFYNYRRNSKAYIKPVDDKK